jgi:hypothetical protein
LWTYATTASFSYRPTENAQERGRPDPSLGQRSEIAAYLAWALGDREDDD